jgi:hypothetical protein
VKTIDSITAAVGKTETVQLTDSGSGGWSFSCSPIAAGSDVTGNGTLAKPFVTLSAALAAMNSANDGTSSYTICIDGTLTEKFADSSTIYCEKIIVFFQL